MAKRGCIVDDMRVSKADAPGWLARELPVQVRPAGAVGMSLPRHNASWDGPRALRITRLGIFEVDRLRIVGKCGLPALRARAEATAPA